jgi:hypothetical protein
LSDELNIIGAGVEVLDDELVADLLDGEEEDMDRCKLVTLEWWRRGVESSRYCRALVIGLTVMSE